MYLTLTKTFKPRSHRRSYLPAQPAIHDFPIFFPPPLSFRFVLPCLFLVELILDTRSFLHFLEVRFVFFLSFLLPSLLVFLLTTWSMQITLFDRVHASHSLGGIISALFFCPPRRLFCSRSFDFLTLWLLSSLPSLALPPSLLV